jgi:hypothetical protein
VPEAGAKRLERFLHDGRLDIDSNDDLKLFAKITAGG